MNIRPGFRIVIAAAVIALAVSCSSNDAADTPATQEQPTGSVDAPNPGAVFEGTYQASQIQESRPDLAPPAQEYQNSVFSVKSFCADDTGSCVASALVSYPNIDPAPPPQPFVIDYVGGKWISNLAFPALSCATESGTPLQAPYWQVATFEQPDGVDDGSVISGTGITHSGPPCAKEYATTYTFTRTGPLDPALQIPPPDQVPPLVESPGAALSGTYDFELTPLSATDGSTAEPIAATGNFQSSCNRTGDRCVSVIDDQTDVLPMLEWSDGTWSSDATYAADACANGSGQQQTTIGASLTNQDPSISPAQSLTGEVRKTYSGDCPGEVAWSITATRTGD